MADIKTLVKDIYALFTSSPRPTVSSELATEFGKRVADLISRRLTEERTDGYLRISNLGTPCDRKLWYSVNTPSDAEALSPETRIKFLYGDILEELLLFLAKLAGHEVTGEQEELDIAGIKGHRDAIIDGQTVDVKSASTYSFKKFRDHELRDDDPFGYLTQLGSYVYSSKDDPKITLKNSASFLAIDKTLGHICLDTYNFKDVDYNKVAEEKKALVAKTEPPERCFKPVPEGKSGNMKLPTVCSYCSFKKKCWPEARVFLYSSGPVYLTTVKNLPRVPEVLK